MISSKAELLAPSGDFEKLKTAILYGADAVYLAGEKYGMRAFCKNFDNQTLKEAVEYAHQHGVKAYITVNIIPHNSDLKGLEEYLSFLGEIKVDGVIVSDLGIMATVKKVIPQIPLHISTQFSAVNYKAINELEKLGATRVVLARELSFEEIKEIKEKTTVELEVFVHGAMCMAYSGRCMISNHTKNRDGNRGQCNQSCRFSYKLFSKQMGEDIYVEEDANGSFFFNSKDLCLIEYLDKLMEIGISSFKLEGRMKTISYLSSVVSVYRNAIDAYYQDPANYQLPQGSLEELAKISNRGYTTFKFLDKTVKESQEVKLSKKPAIYDICGIVKEIIDRKVMVVEVKNPFHPGDEIDIIIPGKRTLNVSFNDIRDVLGREVRRTNPNQIVVLKHFKSVVPGSILRAKA